MRPLTQNFQPFETSLTTKIRLARERALFDTTTPSKTRKKKTASKRKKKGVELTSKAKETLGKLDPTVQAFLMETLGGT